MNPPLCTFHFTTSPMKCTQLNKTCQVRKLDFIAFVCTSAPKREFIRKPGKKWSIPLSKLDETSQWRCSWRDNSHRLLARSWSLTARRHRLACSPYYNKQLPSGGWRKKQVVNGQVKTRMYLGFLKVVPGWWRDRSHLWHSHHTAHRKNGATSWFRFEIEWTP
jgi:hypothetical protein